MKIGTKLILTVFVPLLTALLVGLALIYSYRVLETAQGNGDKVRLIRNSITEINHLVGSYVTYPEERPKEQFQAEYKKLIRLIAAARFRNTDQQQLSDELRFNSQSIKDAFLRLVTNNEHPRPAGSNKLFKETEDLLEGQLLLRSYKADSIASTLRNLVDEDIKKTQSRTFVFVFLILGLTTIPVTVVLIQMRKRITTALTKLRLGTEIVSSGDMDHVITVEREDELGDLTQAFNRMTSNLKEVTASKSDLEREMAERQKAETELRASQESLKKAHNGLEIKVAERTEELTAEIDQRKRTEDALRESEEELRYLSSQILVAQEKERREIAEDLHDNTWQILNSIKIDVDQWLSQKTADDPAIDRQTGNRIIANIREAIEKIRTMQGDLWPPTMEDIGLLATITWYLREFEKTHAGIILEKQIGVSEDEVPQDIKIVIYRVMQEALKNAATHSGAKRVLLSLKKDGPGIEFAVIDNGDGFDPEKIFFRARSWAGFGLMGMKERIEHSNGTFEIRTGVGSGTTVRAFWPLNGTDQEIPDRLPARPGIDIQEEPFRRVTETISDWVYAFRVEPEGKILWDWVTPGFSQVTGYNFDADLTKILHPEDKTVVGERFRHILALRPHVSEYRIVTKSGETCWVRDSVSPAADPLHPGTIRVIGAAQNITSQKQGEVERIQQKVILEGINKIFREALIARSDEEVGRVCLAVAEEVTQSKFGFIGEIGPDGLLHDIAISDPGWELCAIPEKTGHRRTPGDFKIHGLYGRVLRDGKSLLANTPAEHPDSIGTPPGHPPLKAFLGVPLIREEQTIGLIAVGNREGGYTLKELESLEALAPAIVQAFERKRTEAEIHQRVEELTRFNRAAVDRELRMIELKKQINELCGRLGQQPRYPLDFGPGQESPAVPQGGRS